MHVFEIVRDEQGETLVQPTQRFGAKGHRRALDLLGKGFQFSEGLFVVLVILTRMVRGAGAAIFESAVDLAVLVRQVRQAHRQVIAQV